METYLIWLVAGLFLVIAELITGTFFLLFLGIAALLGAAVAWLGAPFWLHATVAAIAAIAGVMWVRRHRRHSEQPAMASLDIGQPVTLDAWVDQAEGVARVKYRDALWDAHVDDEARGEPGEVLYIRAVHGSMLRVAKSRGEASRS